LLITPFFIRLCYSCFETEVWLILEWREALSGRLLIHQLVQVPAVSEVDDGFICPSGFNNLCNLVIDHFCNKLEVVNLQLPILVYILATETCLIEKLKDVAINQCTHVHYPPLQVRLTKPSCVQLGF